MAETDSADRAGRPAAMAGMAIQTRADPFDRAGEARFSWRRAGPVLSVGVGGALGGVARYGVTQVVPDQDGIPWATFTVNVVGAFVLAVLLILILDLWPPRRHVRPFLCTGFLGAFTTFSALSVEIDQRAADGSPSTALTYLALSLVSGFMMAALGLTLGHRITRRGQPRRRRDMEV